MLVAEKTIIKHSSFTDVQLLPSDPILGLPAIFAADKNLNKVNLGIGAYTTAEGPYVLKCVKKAEALILNKYNKEYLPIDGLQDLIKVTIQLIFGKELFEIGPERIYAAQTIGGSGALRVGGEFFSKLLGRNIFLPQPTWANHKPIFEKCNLNVGSYPYLDVRTSALDFTGMYQAINNLPAKSCIILHACCHNPTGVGPSLDQWHELSNLIKKRNIFPFFDCAYQGFGVDLEQDAQAIKIFALDGHEMMIAYSFSKNFGLYGERVGALVVLANEQEAIPKIRSQICPIIRANYSSPPKHGAHIVSNILNSPELTNTWINELENMCNRVKEIRKALVAALLVRGKDNNFNSILQQKGLFSFLSLQKEQVYRLQTEFGIYTPNGRINLAGLKTNDELEYVANAILAVS